MWQWVRLAEKRVDIGPDWLKIVLQQNKVQTLCTLLLLCVTFATIYLIVVWECFLITVSVKFCYFLSLVSAISTGALSFHP